MTIHREGTASIIIAFVIFGLINIAGFWFLGESLRWLAVCILVLTLALTLFIVSFFRIPGRTHTVGEDKIVCPADGKVVVIEEVTDEEYFHDRRIQVSIFMSPANVHVNRNPMDGEVLYSHYHAGKYLVAWHPKSSTLNERHSVVLRNPRGTILVKQIAGALAKRIVNYLAVGQQVRQGEEMGFIKFGSRVDVLLPVGTAVDVSIGQSVQGGVTVLGHWA